MLKFIIVDDEQERLNIELDKLAIGTMLQAMAEIHQKTINDFKVIVSSLNKDDKNITYPDEVISIQINILLMRELADELIIENQMEQSLMIEKAKETMAIKTGKSRQEVDHIFEIMEMLTKLQSSRDN